MGEKMQQKEHFESEGNKNWKQRTKRTKILP